MIVVPPRRVAGVATRRSLVAITAVLSGFWYPAWAQYSAATAHQPASPSAENDQSSYYFRYWPNGRAALFKLKDNLVLAIPPQYQKFWLQKDQVVRAPAQAGQIPKVAAASFVFFLPNFSGYTPSNYLNDFDEDEVEVVELEAADPRQTEPDAPGFYPPNMLKHLLDAHLLRSDDYRDQYGLRCYRQHVASNLEFLGRITCYGRRDEVDKEDIMFFADTGPRSPALRFPHMQAEYFTRRYGGLRIVWRTNVKNLPRWHDIDAQIWKFIDAWNTAP